MKTLVVDSFRAVVAALLIAVIPLSGCKKDTLAPAPATKGLIIGRITPVDAVTGVMISLTSGAGGGATVSPSPSGIFTFRDVSPGIYRVTFNPATGYYTPAARTVTVTAGDTASVGMLTASARPTAAFRVDNDPVSPDTVEASLTTGLLKISLISLRDRKSASLTLGNVTGPGTYPLTGTSSGGYGFLYGVEGCDWNTGYGGTGGSVTLTRYDASTRSISGTFFFNAYRRPTNSTGCGPAEVNVTHGSFENVSF